VLIPVVDERADGVVSWRTEMQELRLMAWRAMTEKKHEIQPRAAGPDEARVTLGFQGRPHRPRQVLLLLRRRQPETDALGWTLGHRAKFSYGERPSGLVDD
jgi:hypothetical protein